MRDETVARSYAETLFELAERNEGHEAFGAAIGRVAAVLDENPRAKLFLETPRIGASDKKAVIRKALEGEVPANFLNFMLILVDKRRQRLVTEIAREYFELVDEHLGRINVEVTLARRADEEAVDEIGRRLSDLLGKTAIPHVRVKPEILGGIVVKAGDTVYDGSVRRRLASMRRKLLTASLPSA